MSDHILAVSELTIKPGELENFRALIGELVAATQAKEPDTLCYEYYISPDGKQCHIYERYADSAAVMTHMQNFAAFAERFMAAIQMTDTEADRVAIDMPVELTFRRLHQGAEFFNYCWKCRPIEQPGAGSGGDEQ